MFAFLDNLISNLDKNILYIFIVSISTAIKFLYYFIVIIYQMASIEFHNISFFLLKNKENKQKIFFCWRINLVSFW